MITVHKAKIPPHLAFVLKTHTIEACLQEAEVEASVEIQFREPDATRALFVATGRPRADAASLPTVHIAIGAVPADTRRSLTAQFEETVSLEFMVWLEDLAARRPQTPPARFEASTVGGRWHIADAG